MAWQLLSFSQDAYVRFFPLVESSIVVVAERSGCDLFGEHQVDKFVLRIGINVADFPGGNIGLESGLLRKFKSQPRKEELREKMTRGRPRIFKGDDLSPKIFQASHFAVSFCENHGVVVRHASFPTPQE